MIPLFAGGVHGLIGPGFLRAPFVLTRDHTPDSDVATAIASDGVTVTRFNENVARFQGTARRLLLESSRTNLLLNTTTFSTQSATVTAVAHVLSFWGTGTITLTGASTAGPLVGTGANDRVTLAFTPSAGSLTCTASGSVLRAQLEVGAFVSSYVVGGGTQSTRSNDICSAPLTSLNLPATGACTILMDCMVPQNAPAATSPVILHMNDGTENNCYRCFVNIGSSNIFGSRTIATVAANTTAAGSFVAGTPFRLGVAIDGAGRLAVSFNGAAAVTATGGPTSGLTTLRIGCNSSGGNGMFGEVRRLSVLPAVLSDAALAARVGSF